MPEEFDLERYTACDCAQHANQTCDKCAIRGYVESLRASLTRVEEQRERLGYALGRARDAIASLGVDDLGWGNQDGLSDPYPIRDEVVAACDAALTYALSRPTLPEGKS